MPISEVKGRWLPSTPPTSSAVPAATQKNQHYEDDDEKCRGVHVALPWGPLQKQDTLLSKCQAKSGSQAKAATRA